jgi:cation diffusion facilitator CzcD-associated flavoprotein CzcO
MSSVAAAVKDKPSTGSAVDYDAIVMGAGFGGIRTLHELRNMGLSVKVLDGASDVGGAWYWNRYPGARTDTESWAYCFSFSKEVQDEWDWKERMPTWDQVMDYQRYVVDKFDMRKHMQFNSRIKSVVYDEAKKIWTVTTEQGQAFTCTYFISAVGLLTIAYDPPFKGLDSFKGQVLISSNWPKEPVSFVGKRVGIVGAGSTAVQILPTVAETAGHATLFQRTPNYVLPGRNYPLTDAQRQSIKTNYDKIWDQVRNQVFAFPMSRPNRLFDDFTPEEQERIFDGGWEAGGFRFVFETFDDITTNERANAAAAAFVRKKIRAIVKDPKTADLLCPKYSFAIKRPPVSNFYYESYNRDNVSLVDVSNDPIVEITPKGIKTENNEYELDIIIFALGFDGVTGGLTHIEVKGKDGVTMKQKWEAGARTKLGIAVDGFPNLFILCGPQSPFANVPPIHDAAVSWIGKAIQQARDKGCQTVEPTPASVEAWTQHIQDLINMTLLGRGLEQGRWFLGANIPGKTPSVLFYFGGADNYFKEFDKSVAGNFEGFAFS